MDNGRGERLNCAPREFELALSEAERQGATYQ